MARKPTMAQLFTELQERYGREIAEAFMVAARELRVGVDLRRVIAAIEAGNIEAAIAAMNLDRAAFGQLQDAIARAYTSGGTSTAALLPAVNAATGARLVIRFDARNLRAEGWLRDHSAQLVTRIVDDQRTALRSALTDGMARGDNPRTVALDIVGRINRATGRREGGLLGLTSQQERYVASARAELASGEASALRSYLERARRDKRFDRSVLKAIRDGEPLPASVRGRALVAYERRLLQLRGETLGANEAFAALEEAKRESFEQAIDQGKFAEQAVTKTWRHLHNKNPREQHVTVNGQTVGFREHFIMPDGTRMRYPHDPEAPARHTVGCHCQADYRVDFLANVA